jgi:hypothetical protein
MKNINLSEIRRRVSWGSIFGGVITVLAISMLLAILGSSISFFMLDPMSDRPASGVGTAIGIWTILALLISLAAGGFVAGKLAGADGIIHGFLVWGTTLILAALFSIFLIRGAVKVTTNVLGSVFSVTGNILSGTGSVIESGASELSDQVQNIFGNIDFSSDRTSQEVRKDIRNALRKSEVREFQPEYLEGQMKAIRADFNRSIKRLATHPNDADRIISGFTDRLKKRGDSFASSIDRNDLTKAIANNSKMSQAEVEKAVDEYMTLFSNMQAESREQIQNLEQAIDQAKQEWEQIKYNARVEADKISNKAGWATFWSFIALLVGAALCSYAGMFGVKKTSEGYEV